MSDWSKLAQPCTLVLWCSLFESSYESRIKLDPTRAEHSLRFEAGDPFPDEEELPCPSAGCAGTVRTRPAAKKKKRRKSKKRG